MMLKSYYNRCCGNVMYLISCFYDELFSSLSPPTPHTHTHTSQTLPLITTRYLTNKLVGFGQNYSHTLLQKYFIETIRTKSFNHFIKTHRSQNIKLRSFHMEIVSLYGKLEFSVAKWFALTIRIPHTYIVCFYRIMYRYIDLSKKLSYVGRKVCR